MKTAPDAAEVREGCGNVFADLCLPEAQDALARAKLAHRICQVIAERGLSQKKAAEILGLDQPKISALTRGKLNGFTAERLFRFLNDLGQEVEIVVWPTQQAGRRGDVRVVVKAT
jgi:predicted XRE-type DNA-binding protein